MTLCTCARCVDCICRQSTCRDIILFDSR